jgi:acetoin utilization protein AcuC
MTKPIFVYSNQLLQYKFNKEHPFNPIRLKLTYELLKSMNLLSENDIVQPRIATEDELLLVHDPSYIAGVKAAGKGELTPSQAESHGLGTEDTPIFPNMHQAASYLVGSTLTAVDYVMSGKASYALSLGGGLHHGFRGKASGFCIYNDSSIAIEYIKQKYNARVLYIDTDAHHGDGVQWAFYDDPTVCTLSIHETGRYLFPGTGAVNEKGHDKGFGYSINLPLDAFTEDESFLEVYETAVREVAEFFKPDVIITQNGADAHYSDPLTHLASTMKTFKRIPQVAKEVADQYCNGRWIAVGGGGYDIWKVVPRAWSQIWSAMNGKTTDGPLSNDWISKWQKTAPVTLPSFWEDPPNLYPVIPRKKEITEKNRLTLSKALYHIRNG